MSRQLAVAWIVLALAAVCGAWRIDKGAVAVSGRGDAGERVPFARAGTVELVTGRSLEISFETGEDTLPHQAVVRLDDSKGNEKIYLAKYRGKTAKVIIPHKSVPEALLNEDLTATVYVASFEGEPAEAKACDLRVVQSAGAASANARPALSFAALPEIHHQFRAPERTVSWPVAIVFVGGAVALLAALLAGWTTDVGFHLGGVQFVLTLAALEGLFVAYFVKLSIFSTIFYLAVLAPFALFAGRQVLRIEAERRTKRVA